MYQLHHKIYSENSLSDEGALAKIPHEHVLQAPPVEMLSQGQKESVFRSEIGCPVNRGPKLLEPYLCMLAGFGRQMASWMLTTTPCYAALTAWCCVSLACNIHGRVRPVPPTT